MRDHRWKWWSWPGLMAALCACASELPGEKVPEDTLYFPVGITTAPAADRLYVVSSNFDQRFNSGWVSVLSVDALVAAIGGAAGSPFVQRLLVPSQAGRLALHPDGDVGVLPSRGSGFLASVTVAGDGTLSCGNATDDVGLRTELARTDCDDAHLFVLDDAAVEADKLFDGDVTDGELRDPFAAALFTHEGTRYAAIGFLSGPKVSLLSIGAEGQLDHARAFSFGKGATASLTLYPDPARTLLVATSQRFGSDAPQSRILDIDLARSLSAGEDFTTQTSVSAVAGGTELLDLAFTSDAKRALASNRTPDSLVLLDTTLATTQERDDNGSFVAVDRPRYAVLDALALPGRPSGIAMLGDDLVAVSSFDDDAVYIVRLEADTLTLVRRFDGVGAGPFQVAVATSGARTLLLATTFFDHGLAVLDVSGDDPQSFAYLGSLRSSVIKAAGR